MHWIASHLHKQWDQVYQLLVAIQLQNRKGEQSLDDNQKGKTKFLAAGVIGAYRGSPNLLSAKSLFFHMCYLTGVWHAKAQWTKLISVPATDKNVGKKVLKFWDRYANMVFGLPSVKLRFSFTSLVPSWLNFSKWGTNYWSCHRHQRRSMGWRFQLQQPFYYILHRRQKPQCLLIGMQCIN